MCMKSWVNVYCWQGHGHVIIRRDFKLFFFPSEQRTEFRALCLLVKRSTTELNPQPKDMVMSRTNAISSIRTSPTYPTPGFCMCVCFSSFPVTPVRFLEHSYLGQGGILSGRTIHSTTLHSTAQVGWIRWNMNLGLRRNTSVKTKEIYCKVWKNRTVYLTGSPLSFRCNKTIPKSSIFKSLWGKGAM